MEFCFRKAEKNELEEIAEMYRAAVKKMNAAGIYQWDENYPKREHIEGDLAAGSLYVVTADGRIAAAVSHNGEVDGRGNDSEEWNIPGRWQALHRLVAHPDLSGLGLGARAIQGIEEALRAKGYEAVRFDTVSPNTPAMKLYRSLGYSEAGREPWIYGDIVYFEKKLWATPHNCVFGAFRKI